MGKLDSLRIDECPYAFASFAAKHNALCDLIAGMVGENGISVVIAEKNAIIRANIAAGSSSNVAGVAQNVVSSDGTLAAVVRHANYVAPGTSSWPTHLQTGPSTGDRTMMDGGTEISVTDAAFSTYVVLTKTMIKMHGAHNLEIVESALTHDMSIVEIDVCAGQKMLVIGSAPY